MAEQKRATMYNGANKPSKTVATLAADSLQTTDAPSAISRRRFSDKQSAANLANRPTYEGTNVAIIDPVPPQAAMSATAQTTRRTTTAGSRYSRLNQLWPLLWLVWLPNLGSPLTALFHEHPSSLRLIAVLTGTTLFVVIYLLAARSNAMSHATYPQTVVTGSMQQTWLPVALLAVLSIALVLGDGHDWLVLLIFTGASVGGRFRLGTAIGVLAGLDLLTGLLGWLSHDTVSDLGPAMFWTAMAGVLVIIVNHLRLTNRALDIAREENTRLAIEAERLRFARDLHDLLGHDLARIALQSDLAEALVPTAPEKAIEIMRDVGGSARTALQGVRAAVAGYRQPTLAGELRGAAEILAAAGISFHCDGERVALPLPVESVLSWAVREGVTNVVKHSRAQHCTVRLTHDQQEAGVEVRDDGRGFIQHDDATSSLALGQSRGGNGLLGLAERVAELGGRCDSGPIPGGGFHLNVVLPLPSHGLGVTVPDSPAENNAAAQLGQSAR